MPIKSSYLFGVSEDAVASIEYALLAALIAMIILGAVTLTGTKTLDLWQLVARCVAAATSGGVCA